MARVKLLRREVRAGALAVMIELDADGRLRSVKLPRKIPADLDAGDLSGVIGELEKCELAQDAPPFLAKAWEVMRRIPWGSAITYRELAAAAGSPGASRAAGQACARNPLLLVVPCHRVLAEDGLGGFGCGLAWKAKLLELETERRPAMRRRSSASSLIAPCAAPGTT